MQLLKTVYIFKGIHWLPVLQSAGHPDSAHQGWLDPAAQRYHPRLYFVSFFPHFSMSASCSNQLSSLWQNASLVAVQAINLMSIYLRVRRELEISFPATQLKRKSTPLPLGNRLTLKPGNKTVLISVGLSHHPAPRLNWVSIWDSGYPRIIRGVARQQRRVM